MIKTLSRSIREYKKQSLLSPLFVSLEVVLEVLIPLLMAYLVDYGINGGNIGTVWKLGALLVAAALLSLFFGLLAGRYAAAASAGFAKNLRKDLFYKIQTFSFTNIDRFSTSSLVTRLTTDTTNVQNAYMMIVRTLVRSPFMLVFALVMSLRVSSALSLVFLLAVPVLGIGLYVIIRKAHPVFEKVFRIYDKLNRVVQENLRGIRVVKSYVREDYEVEKFDGVSKQVYDKFSLAERILAFNAPLMQFAMYGCTLIISWFGAKMIVGGSLSTGELISLFSYSIQILSSLMLLSMVFVMVTLARASAERITEVLAETPDLQNTTDPVGAVANGDIAFNHVNFSYVNRADKLCLKDINLSIHSGQAVGILGGTGSGKTSLVQLIPRLYDVTSGELLVGGRNVKDYDVATLRDAVAVVLQKNVLFSGTIAENLRWGNKDATDAQLAEACRLAQADSFIKDFPEGYETLLEQGGTNLSGGQRQRLCIARALLKNPKILILDDSTSAVDTATDAKIREAFAENIPGTTKIIIAQRIASIQHADQIVVMDEGKISATGTHEELLVSSEIYREVYTSQQKGGEDHGAA